MRKAFVDTMLEVGLVDPKLVVLVGDISHFPLQPFAKACPGRFYNVGICEPTIVGMAAGLSHAGLHPVAHTIAPFLVERSFEQIKLDFCYQELGGTLITVGSAFDYSGLGCSHYCYDDFALMKALPGTEVLYPAMPDEFRELFKQTYKNGKLTYIRLPNRTHDIELPSREIKIGRAVTVRKGKDMTIVAAGPQLQTAMESISALQDHGLDAEIIYPHTVKPFDYPTVRESIARTKRFLVVEEHGQFGGIHDEVMRAVRDVPDVTGEAINIPDKFCHGYGSYQDHCEHFGLTVDNVIEKALALGRVVSRG